MNAPSDTLRRAIAIRQPMAWALIHAGKDVENRPSSARRLFKLAVGERVLILASKGMTPPNMRTRRRSWPALASGVPSTRRCSSAA